MTDQNQIANAYNQHHYESGVYPQTHPNRLAVQAALFGLTPAPVATARVLELGTGDATNLIAMAASLPQASFLGIDFAEAEVARANATIQTLGLKNIRVEQADILTYTVATQAFDYIIAHGVYSWVPDTVRNKVLAICQTGLSKHGVAFISYNAYPGWHRHATLRDLLKFTSDANDTASRVQEARQRLKAFATPYTAPDPLYHQDLLFEIDRANAFRDDFLLHDTLADINQPFYFHEFMEAAKTHGLQFLAEAEWVNMLTPTLPEALLAELARVKNDLIKQEQLLDFIRNRYFRETLLCHDNVPIHRQVTIAALKNMQFKTYLMTTDTFNEQGSASFQSPEGNTITVHDILHKVILFSLANHAPLAMNFSDLFKAIKQGLGLKTDFMLYEQKPTLLEPLLLNTLYALYARGLITAFYDLPTLATQLSDQPTAWPMARLQAQSGLMVGNPHHESIAIDHFTHHLLPLLDGKHDHAMLLAGLTERHHQGKIQLSQGGNPITDPTAIQTHLDEAMTRCLMRLLKLGLFIA